MGSYRFSLTQINFSTMRCLLTAITLVFLTLYVGSIWGKPKKLLIETKDAPRDYKDYKDYNKDYRDYNKDYKDYKDYNKDYKDYCKDYKDYRGRGFRGPSDLASRDYRGRGRLGPSDLASRD